MGISSSKKETPKTPAPKPATTTTNYYSSSLYYSEPQRYTSSAASYNDHPRRTTYESSDLRNLSRNFQSLRISNQVPSNYNLSAGTANNGTLKAPIKSQKDSSKFNIDCEPFFNPNLVVSFIQLSEYDSDYHTIKRMVTNKQNFKIDSIEKIENPYLKKAYELKKEEKQKLYGYVEERLLFHGTSRTNLDSICKYNFNWRLCKQHKYGNGVSFSPNSTYASNYSDKVIYNKVMIVAKVLIAKSCIGDEFMVLPDQGCDTSQKGEDAIVIVKYEDNEFCPLFKINYHLVRENTPRRNNRRGGGRRRNYSDDFDY